MAKKCFLLVLIILQLASSFAQDHVSDNRPRNTVQEGLSIKLTVEVLRNAVHPRLGLDAGLGIPLIAGHIMPAFNLEYELFYGGWGTRSGWQKSPGDLGSDIIVSGMMTFGIADRLYSHDYRDLVNRNQPLYYFSDMVQPALQNPFDLSLSVGTNFVWPQDGGKVDFFQRVGYVNIHITRFQLGYYNDGGGMEKALLGDGKDRYYTGGGFISITLPANVAVNQILASYHKFSGYYKETFEDTNEMNLSFVNYRDINQQYYNRSYWNLSVGNVKTGLAAFYRINNPYNRGDFQNTIHYVVNNGYHQIPYPKYYSFGVSYFYSYQQIGIK